MTKLKIGDIIEASTFYNDYAIGEGVFIALDKYDHIFTTIIDAIPTSKSNLCLWSSKSSLVKIESVNINE